MKIAFFTDSYFPEIDGVTYTLKTWKERLEDEGHEVYIIYPANSEYDSKENEIGVTSIPNPFYSGYNIPIPTGYGKIPGDLDIVHCHGPGPVGRLGRRYAKKKNVPKVYTHHTPVEEYFEQHVYSSYLADFLTKIYLPIENRFLSSFDRVTASTGKMEREVESDELPVGIDMDFFQPTEKSFLDKMEIEGPVIGYSGRVSIEENLEELCKVAERFDGTVVIVGEGPQRENIENMAGDNVEIMGFLDRDKLPEFYSGIEAFVTPSTGDTLGLSTLEANACGTPVVAADVHPFDKTIQENGERFELRNLDDMKQKIETAINKDYESREAVRKYSVEKTIEQLQEIYREEVSKNGN